MTKNTASGRKCLVATNRLAYVCKACNDKYWIMIFSMDKLQLTGQNLDRVFNFRFGHLHDEHFWCYK
jgi:hypothetical protein